MEVHEITYEHKINCIQTSAWKSTIW
jgi:hypothetical protein